MMDPFMISLVVNILLISLLFFLSQFYKFCHETPILFYITSPTIEKLLSLCPRLKSYDRIPIWGFNGHIQSFYASMIRKGPAYPHKIIVPGIAGHPGNDYIKNFIHACQIRGFRTVCWNWPGCGDHSLQNTRLSTLGDWSHLDIMFRHIRDRYPSSPIFAMGFSLGANLLLRYLGHVGDKTPVSAAFSSCCGYCGLSGLRYLRKNTFYSRLLVGKWKQVFNRHQGLWAQRSDIDIMSIQKARSLEQFDRLLSTKILSYSDVESYYTDHSSIDLLESIQIPTMMINSLDDPIVTSQLIDLAKEKVKLNPHLILATTRYGGHMGWVTGNTIKPNEELWIDEVALEFITSCEFFLGKDFKIPIQQDSPILDR